MLTYFLIGVIVQILICIARTIRGVAAWNEVTGWAIPVFVVLALTNALIWPITLVAEAYNTINGV